MKKLCVILIMLLFAVSAFANGLNPEATRLKTNNPNIYSAVKNRAIIEWGTDHEMIVYTINKQCEAIFKLSTLSPKLTDVEFYAILIEWCEDDLSLYDSILSAPVDWCMVVYVMEKQIEAKSQY